jgi:hypothetical protein
MHTKKKKTSAYAGTSLPSTLKIFDEMNTQQRGDVVKCASLIFNIVTKSGVAKSLEKKYLPLEEIGDKDRRPEKECRSVQRGDSGY